MKDTIKKSFVWWIVFLFTVIIWSYVYAATVWTVNTWDTLTASMWNAMAGNYNYSTSDVDTGKKWIDGKPIYRRVVNLWDLSSYASNSGITHSEPLGLDNPDTLLSTDVSLNWYSDMYTYRESDTSEIFYFVTKDEFFMKVNLYHASKFSNVVIIVEYTKTTD